MATRGTVTDAPAFEQQREFPTLIQNQNSMCVRCGGLMVGEFCMDLLGSSGEQDCPLVRCVQCGDVVDAVIERNRRLLGARKPPSRAELIKHALSPSGTGGL